MSQFKKFMKANKKVKENVTYAATKSITDENGEPVKWTLRPLTTKENEIIRDDCTSEVPVKGKPNMYRAKFNSSKYLAMVICASVIEPNLNNAELQDDYGVKSDIDLLREMVDDPGEYSDLAAFVQGFNGFDTSLDEKVEEAKN